MNRPMTYRKSKMLSKLRGALHLWDELGERSADRPAAAGIKAARTQLRLSCGTRKVEQAMRRETTSGETTRRNIDAPVSGGATDMSVEASVMDAEQSGGVVRSMRWVNSATKKSP